MLSHKALLWTSIIILAIVSVISFTLSFIALREMAIEYLYLDQPFFGSLWPILVDTALIGFSVAAAVARMSNQSSFKFWLLVSIYTVLTIIFNVLHAPDNFISKFMAIIPPLTLVGTFEVFLYLFNKFTQELNNQTYVEDKLGHNNLVEDNLNGNNLDEFNKLNKFRDKKRNNLIKLMSLIKLGETNLSEKLKVSQQTIDNYINELRELNLYEDTRV